MTFDEVNGKLPKVKEKFSKVRELLEEHQKINNEREPYKLKYAAINLLREIEIDLNNVLNSNTNEEQKEDAIVMLGIVYFYMGLLHADTEELKAGEEQFMKCLDLLKGKELEAEAVLPVLSALNQLGIIWSQWNQPTKAKAFLERAEQIYKDFTDTKNSCRDPVHMATHFGIEDTKEDLSPKYVLEGVYTLTLYYLAQVYVSMKDHHKSAVYCHMTLQRQLEYNDIMKDLDYIDWALNAATLSQYFMENDKFPQGRHHLAAASYILQKYENLLNEESGTEEQNEVAAAKWENYKHRKADVARCWAKYGILLLNLSKQRLLQKTENDQPECQLYSKIDSEKSFDDLKFDMLMNEIEPFSSQITDAYLLDFNDARPVFLNIQKWLDEAKTYYTLDNHASDYVQIIQDMSQAYKHLAFFEENEDRQARMHKRRINILEATVKELNPQYYKTVCRQIWMELGETYSDILDIKLDRLRSSDEKLTPQALSKINHLARTAIKHFQSFLDSLENITSEGGIAAFPDDVVQPALCAYFHIGRLYNKLITLDKTAQLENTQNSMNAYKSLIDYCEKHPKAAEIMKQELNLCKEIINLLPMKADKLRQKLMEP